MAPGATLQIADKVPDKALVLMRALCFYGDMLKKPEVPLQNANKNKFDVVRVEVKPVEYLAQLEQAIEQDRAAEGKRELKASQRGPATREIKVSRSDKDAGYMVREGKPKGFFYLDHRTVDSQHAIITDTHATPATVHDSVPYLRRLDRQRERFGFQVQAVGLDAGYATAALAQGWKSAGFTESQDIGGRIEEKGCLANTSFAMTRNAMCMSVPTSNCWSIVPPTARAIGNTTPIRRSAGECALRGQCTRSKNMVEVMTRHVWQAARGRVDRAIV